MALAAAGTAGLLVLEALPEMILCKAIGTTVAGLSDLAQKKNDLEKEKLETQRVLAENERIISENERIKAEQYAKAMTDREKEKYRKKAEENERLKRELDEKNRRLDEKIEADRQTMQDLKDTVMEYQAKMDENNAGLVNRDRLFEKMLRKMQSKVTRFSVANNGNEAVQRFCLDFTDIIDSYEDFNDIPRLEESLCQLRLNTIEPIRLIEE